MLNLLAAMGDYTNPYRSAGFGGMLPGATGNPAFWQAQHEVARQAATSAAARQDAATPAPSATVALPPQQASMPLRYREAPAPAEENAPASPRNYTDPAYHQQQLMWLLYAL